MSSIPSNIIDEVRNRVALSELVAEYTDVKRSGKGFISRCPFHDDKTPSFSISDELGLYNCFGCGKKGNTFDFVMEKKGFFFQEAVRYLAKLVGVTIPESEREVDREAVLLAKKRKTLMREVNYAVSEIYHQYLKESQKQDLVWEYIGRRNISAGTIDQFQLGFAPPIWEYLLSKLSKKLESYKEDQILEILFALGLIKKNKLDRHYDTFRNRLIFPVTRSDGVVVAFGGRLIVENEPGAKYINSSESPIYTKGQTFYGLKQAFNAIRSERHVYLVEGYMDVIAMHQFANQHGSLSGGIGKACLATCGTAVTQNHVRVLKRIAEKVTVLFDADTAGLKAAANCFEMFLNSGLDVRAVVLPAEEDPDSLLSRPGLSAGEISNIQDIFKSNTRPIFEVFLDFIFAESNANPLQLSSSDIGNVAKRVAKTVYKVANPVEREMLIRKTVDRLGVTFSAFEGLVKQQAKNSFLNRAESRQQSPRLRIVSNNGLSLFSRQLVVSLLCNPALSKSILSSSFLSNEEDSHPAIPDNVRQFIESLAEKEFTGLAIPGMDLQAEMEQLKSVLMQFDLAGLGLFEEAINLAKMEGSSYVKAVEDIIQNGDKFLLRREVKKIKIQEAQTNSPEELVKLAQEKLMKRRGLEGNL